MKIIKIMILCAIYFTSTHLEAGNPFFLTIPVVSDANYGLVGDQARANSGLVVLRYQVPGQAAFQLAGTDGAAAGRIFSRASGLSYALTDVGSQWTSSIVENQTIFAIIECVPGQFGWNGPAFSGAGIGKVDKLALNQGRIQLNSISISAVPLPQLIGADSSYIKLTIPAFADASGLAVGLELWRKGTDGIWSSLAQLSQTAQVQVWVDTQVQANATYWYGVSVIYGWPGGGQAGALPGQSNVYVSNARYETGIMAAAKDQPSPTPFPTQAPLINHNLGKDGWLAAPNPSRDGLFLLQFQTTKPSTWRIKAFGLDGSLVRHDQGGSDLAGWQSPELDLSHFASGLYLLELRVTQEGEAEKSYPIRKVAIIR